MASIILIDDDPLFASMARRALELDGHRVAINPGAFGALTAVRQGRFDVILVDIQMPDIDGQKLVQILRDRGVGAARIIQMSSIAADELERIARRDGADGWFHKPSGVHNLTVLVRALTRRQSQSPMHSPVRSGSHLRRVSLRPKPAKKTFR